MIGCVKVKVAVGILRDGKGLRRSRGVRKVAVISAVVGVLLSICATAAQAATGPVYDIKAIWGATNLGAPDAQGNAHVGEFYLLAQNVGDGTEEAAVTITDELPQGVTISAVEWEHQLPEEDLAPLCSGLGTQKLTCTIPASRTPSLLPAPGSHAGGFSVGPSGFMPPIFVDVNVATGASGTGINTARVSDGGAAVATDVDHVPLSETPVQFGVIPGSFESDVFSAAYPFGTPVRQAGDHPFEQRVNFDFNEETGLDNGLGGDGHRYTGPVGRVKDVEVTLPRGMIGNPEATPKCDPTVFASPGVVPNSAACPPDTQVGYLDVWIADGPLDHGEGAFPPNYGATATRIAIYNVRPPRGVPADFGFNAGGLVLGHIYPELDPARDYAIKTLTLDISSIVSVRGVRATFWGVPADPTHDVFRYYTKEQPNGDVIGASAGNAALRPLLTTPMDCGQENGGALISVDSYLEPGNYLAPLEGTPLNVTGCDDPRFRFEPNVSLQPSDMHAGAPTGLEVHLKVPQRNDEAEKAEELYAQNGFVKGIATPPIKKTVVTLPEGMTLSPSAGQGLTGCTLEEVGMSVDGVPNDNPVRCPDSSQIGTLTLHTPVLPINEPMEGQVYIAAQDENPFKTSFAMYLVIEQPERGLLVKLPGRIDLDPGTGQIVTTFDDLPQFPVSDMQLKFKGGARAALVNPSTCGRKTMTAEFFSWQEPNTPHVVSDAYEVTQKPDGSPCANTLAQRPFSPGFSAGTVDPVGGAFSPFTMNVTRTDDEQEISQISMKLAPGLLARIAGVQQCSEAGIAQAQVATRTGREELADPSCPAGSQVGSTYVGAGVGSTLTYVPGKIYFAGPYKGAPFSLVVITPTVVGPYDLGVVAVRSALYIDTHTSQATAVSDPLPLIFKGIPVRLRDVRITIDRPEFIFNPTNCSELHLAGGVTSDAGVNAPIGSRFQVANCASLAFKPKFTASTSAKASRVNGASLDVKVSYPKAAWGTQANIAKVKVMLPKQLPSRLTTLQKGCPDHVFEENPAACPAASRIGMATSTTPVLSGQLAGPAYFVSHGGAKFPELIIVLQGDGVTVHLNGETFISSKGITSSTFRTIPDVPVKRFELKLPQGPYSALGPNGSLCAGKLLMPTTIVAQNGAVMKRSTKVGVKGCGKHKGKKRKRHAHRHRAHKK